MSARPDITPRLMPAPLAARYLGVSESTLRELTIRRRMLRTKRLYDRVRAHTPAESLGCPHPSIGSDARNSIPSPIWLASHRLANRPFVGHGKPDTRPENA